MPFVLRECLAIFAADVLSSALAPAATAFQILVQAVLRSQPRSLAVVTREHRQFAVELFRDVHHEPGGKRLAEVVHALDRIDVVQMRNRLRWRCGVPLMRFVIGHRGVEARVSNQPAGDLVIADVIDGRGCDDQIGMDSPEELRHATSALVVKHNRQVSEFETKAVGTECLSGRFCLISANFRNLLSRHFRAAAITRRHRRNRNVMPSLRQPKQATSRLELYVVRMCMNGKNPPRITIVRH